MPRIIVGISEKFALALLAVLWLAALLLAVLPAHAGMADARAALAERSLGAADAPVVMNEYMSLTCPHCGNFHKNTWPKIKAAYVDTGKVRFIMNDFPLGEIAMDAHMLARCAPNNRYFGMIDAFFATQSRWRASDTPRADLKKIAQLSGLSGKDADACLDNEALRTGLAAAKAVAHDKYGIKATPSFYVDDKKIPGALPFDDFKQIIDKALAKKGVK